jgi:hypothetical protein
VLGFSGNENEKVHQYGKSATDRIRTIDQWRYHPQTQYFFWLYAIIDIPNKK